MDYIWQNVPYEKTWGNEFMELNSNSTMLQYQVENERVSEIISISGCSDTMSCTVADIQPGQQGRIVEIGARIRRVCPGKRVALGNQLHELDENNNEHPRGQKTMTLPAHHEQSCRDIVVRGVRFVLPEDISVAESCSNGSSCAQRRFRVRTLAHYVDFDSECDCDRDD